MPDSRPYRTTGVVPTLGMRGSGTFTANEMPDSWRHGILRLDLAGDAPLTGITSHLKNTRDKAHFHWFTKTLADIGADLSGSGVYTTPALSAAYSGSAAVDGDVVYARITKDDSYNVRVGHIVSLRDTAAVGDPYNQAQDTVGKVVDVQRSSDATSFIAVRLSENDNGLVDSDRFVIIGNSNADGGPRPAAISRNASERGNYQQLWRTSFGLTGTEIREKDGRLGDTYAELKLDALRDHAIEIETSLIFGVKGIDTAENGQVERTTGGIIEFIKNYASSNVVDYSRSTDYTADTWATGGEDWLNDMMELSFKYGSDKERMVFCGGSTLTAINKIASAGSTYTMTGGEAKYGIKVKTLECVHGQWHFIQHPLFSHEETMQKAALVMRPKDIEFRYLLDTKHMKDDTYMKGGGEGIDGKREEFMTQGGLAIHFPETFMWLTNFGVDNILSS